MLTDTVFIVEDDKTGGGSQSGLDAAMDDTLELAGVTEHRVQGVHVKLTINAEGSQGADTKHKVFWVTGCGSPPPTTNHHHHDDDSREPRRRRSREPPTTTTQPGTTTTTQPGTTTTTQPGTTTTTHPATTTTTYPATTTTTHPATTTTTAGDHHDNDDGSAG